MSGAGRGVGAAVRVEQGEGQGGRGLVVEAEAFVTGKMLAHAPGAEQSGDGRGRVPLGAGLDGLQRLAPKGGVRPELTCRPGARVRASGLADPAEDVDTSLFLPGRGCEQLLAKNVGHEVPLRRLLTRLAIPSHGEVFLFSRRIRYVIARRGS